MVERGEVPGGEADAYAGGLRPGEVIAERYRLEEPIGTGGSATIWRAAHLALDRPVAVKFVDVIGPRQAQLRERFIREAKVAAAIRHRNVVDIVDFGADSGRPFMVMELLEGQTLARRLERGPALTVSEAVRMIAPVLSGLGAVHEAGIVHRDLKPENIFLVEDADGYFPKLIDFGVSRVLDSSIGLESVLPTRDNVIVGTPQYMAPEQARGLREIDARADLWSAGVMLFELLTGVLPFDSDAVGDVIIDVATRDVPQLSSLRPELEGPLSRVVHGALERDPEDRFQTASEMRTALLEAVKATASDILGHRPPVGDKRPAPAPPAAVARMDVSSVSDELEVLDAHLSVERRPSTPPRDETITLASTGPHPAAPAPPARSRWWLLAVGLLALLLLGYALSRTDEPVADEPTPPPRAVAPPPEIPAPQEEPLPPEPTVEPAILEEAEVAPERPASRGRRRARVVRDPGF